MGTDTPERRVRRRRSVRLVTALLLFATSSAVMATGGCPATEQALIGAWSRSGNAGFLEAFALEVDSGARVFNSWLHERPEISDAAWTLENCQLIVVPAHGELPPFRFTVLQLDRGRLRLRDESNDVESTYARLPPDQ